MKLESIILKTGDVIGHLVATGLSIDAINNAHKGNYDLAAVEGIISLYIEASKYYNKKREKIIIEFSDRVSEFSKRAYNEYIPQLKAMTDRLK